MYIKEIKINAFKSFADKVSISLNPTFTGIVGPNGSGKSNIVDAIKWALGEQSVKTLRGSLGMTDVIFSGSKSRNSSNQASVSITFDNSDSALSTDYEEVIIKRVVFKNGDNEYYLNNQKCRLKDITDLMVDSFSSKESFNIIPQNKIEEILSDKPEDRRIIFEEAAGVLKYKKRKEESLRKLAKTHDNIDRIDMILSEIKEQIEPLEISSKKAIEYKKTKEKLENVDISLIIKDITQFNELYTNKKELKEKYELEFASLTKINTKENNDLEKLKIKNLELENDIKELRETIIIKKEKLSELLSKKELSVERSKYDKNSSQIKNKVIDLKDNELKADTEIKSLLLEIDKISSESKIKEQKLSEVTLESNKINNEIETENINYNNLNKKKIETESKIELMKSNLENMAKLPYAVKAILDNPTLSGINNIIGNIVETKKEYSTMLEIALGSSSNYIIVENEANAKEAINYLKNNNKGRATFFPLSVIKPKSIEPSVLESIFNMEGYLGIASDLVQYDIKYYNIIMNQLGNILVVSDINDAIKISKLINYRYRVVTLSGEIFHVGGSLSGGSIKSNNSYISDKYEIDKLCVLMEHIKNNIIEKDKIIKNLQNDFNIINNNIINLNLEIIKLKESINIKQESLNSYKELQNKIKQEIKDLSYKNESSIENIVDKIMEEYHKLEIECNASNIKLDSIEKEKRDILDEINEKELNLKKTNLSYNNLTEKINSLEIDIVKLNMALDNLLNRLNEEYNLTYEGAKTKYLLEIEENEARSIVNDLKRIIKSIGAVNLDSIEEYERINKRFTFLNTQKDDLLKSESDILEIIDQMDSVMKDKFSNTFYKINKEFNNVFTDLFGGGEANLKLTNPNNMLETGIDIIAVPPGKNMKSISLLSGGEKTLTAISLLFSIMNLKKVPFVVLDEVESALDEVNAEKFGEYLSHYRNKTQMLIITHKKKTMEYVDLLYGVTMQESGVSKLVSVKLENLK